MQTMNIEIIGAESLGVRSLCCRVRLPGRCLVIDPGVSLGYMRHGLLPHPVQVAVGRRVRSQILTALEDATDVVFSHYHGDHIPLKDANPYQLAVSSLPPAFFKLPAWGKSASDLTGEIRKRFQDLSDLLGQNMRVGEGQSDGVVSFSGPVAHGVAGSNMGSVMMTRVEIKDTVFVHASDIQLLDDFAVDQVISWQPDILLAAGPPLYLNRLSSAMRETAWRNAVRLAQQINMVILDHHVMRGLDGPDWLEALSRKIGRQVYCAADYMHQPRRLLEAERAVWYQRMPVAKGWHDDYVAGKVDPDRYLEQLPYRDLQG